MGRSVKDYLSGINRYIFLPGLQREFVWSPQQMENLFDSLIRGYPVGILTEWNVRGSSVEDFHSYQFLQNYIASQGRVPEEVSEEFSRYNNPMPDDTRPDYLVIDGQQRLNSLFIGVRGEIAEFRGGKGHNRGDPTDWQRKQLCVDLLGHPDFRDDHIRGDYRFKFRRTSGFGWDSRIGYEQTAGTHHLWMPVNEFWDGGLVGQSEKRNIVDEYVGRMPVEEETRTELRDVATTVATDLYGDVLDDDLKTDSVDHDTNHIPEIFQRLNTEGADPKPYQLLMSKLMSYWPYAEDEEQKINPRDRVEDWLDGFYEQYPEYEDEIGRDLWMRYSTYLIKQDLLESSIKHFDKEVMDDLRDRWLGGGHATYGRFEWFRSGLEKAFETIIDIGLRPRVMRNTPTIAVIGVFYYFNPDAKVNEQNRNSVFRFIAQCLLLNESYAVFTIGNARSWMRYLNEHTDEYETFPGEELLEHENLNPSTEDIRLVVENARYSGEPGQPVFTDQNVAAILGLLDQAYTSEAQYDISDYDVDHIFPKSRQDEIESAVGASVDLDRIGNLQLLRSEYNREEKRKMMPQEWFDDISDAEAERIRRVGQYPDVALEPSEAKRFIERREEQLIEHLSENYVR